MGAYATRGISGQMVVASEDGGFVNTGPGVFVGTDADRRVIDEPDANRMRFLPSHASGAVWPASGATERWVCLWQPVPVSPDGWFVGPAAVNDAGIALLSPLAVPGTEMRPEYKRGTAGYPFLGCTEFYVLELTAPTAPHGATVIISKAKMGDSGTNLADGSVLLVYDTRRQLNLEWRSSPDGPGGSVTVRTAVSHVHGTLAVIATQIDAGGVVRMWMNGSLVAHGGFAVHPSGVLPTDSEVMLLGWHPSGDPAAVGAGTFNAHNCRIREISLHPGRMMSREEVEDRTAEYWHRYQGSFDLAPKRTRFHCGPATPGDAHAHMQMDTSGRPPLVAGGPITGDSVAAWFGEPHPAATWRRWLSVGSGVLYTGTSPTEPYAFLSTTRSGIYGQGGLAMMGPGAQPSLNFGGADLAANATPFTPRGVVAGAELPFAFFGCTAVLVLHMTSAIDLAAPGGWILSKAATKPSGVPGEMMHGAHSVALYQTRDTKELVFGVWGDADWSVVPAAQVRIPMPNADGVVNRYVVVLRLAPDALSMRVSDVFGGLRGDVRVPLAQAPPARNPYELLLLTNPDAYGRPQDPGTGCHWAGGRLHELRLYEGEVLSDAQVASVVAELEAMYPTLYTPPPASGGLGSN